MNGRFTMGLAGLLLLVGAIVVGCYWGLLSQQPAPDVPTFVPLTAADLVLERYWAGENDSSANFYATHSHLFQFTQLALGSASKGLARNDTVATLHPGIEVIRGNQAPQQTP
jgi:hypothetical protein